MFRKLTLTAIAALALTTGPAFAAGEAEVTDYDFSFEGPFGSFDQMQLQRGLQVYSQICSACHGLEYVAFRTLEGEGGVGWTDDEVRAYIEFQGYEVFDPLLFDGEGDFRPAVPSDYFPESGLSSAPDLSLMAKARAGFHGPAGTGLAQLFKGMGGAEYIASLLTGYREEPECAEGANMDGYYNVAFAAGGFPESCIDHGHHTVPGSWIAMAPPLMGDDVVFADGHSTDLEHEAEDIAAFLMWAAEPKMMARQRAGLSGVIFLSLLAVLLYLTNKRLWSRHKKAIPTTEV